jgi:hypothetical protein
MFHNFNFFFFTVILIVEHDSPSERVISSCPSTLSMYFRMSSFVLNEFYELAFYHYHHDFTLSFLGKFYKVLTVSNKLYFKNHSKYTTQEVHCFTIQVIWSDACSSWLKKSVVTSGTVGHIWGVWYQWTMVVSVGWLYFRVVITWHTPVHMLMIHALTVLGMVAKILSFN